MEKLQLNYNNQKYNIKIRNFYDGISIAILLEPQDNNSEELKIVSIASEVPPMIDNWVLVDTNNYPDIEDVLIENKIIEPDIVTQICYGSQFYPCYSLTDAVYEKYQSEISKKELV
ncbi:hypothetical protein LDL00_11630 [Staphylococcus epidermidis]|uniref:hypothetical protein n=1 Tax=Staphylococcus epidermidis TaxID=1282 RepID=UPI001E5625D6|nr:hypothetical protein [Staphylococcus epidermidis]MCD9074475.1 hypothetical protein [Staphylococcus epidermidis]